MKTEKVILALEKLSEKLGTTAEEIMYVYIKNAKMYRFYFIVELIFSLALLAIGILLIFWFYPTLEIKNYLGLVWDVKNIIGVVGGSVIGIVGFVCTISTVSSFRSFVNSWINPEYEAYEDLFGTLFN